MGLLSSPCHFQTISCKAGRTCSSQNPLPLPEEYGRIWVGFGFVIFTLPQPRPRALPQTPQLLNGSRVLDGCVSRIGGVGLDLGLVDGERER